MSDHPHLALIEAEVERAENDLDGFRERSLKVVTASAGIVTLLTGFIAFAASKGEEDQGLPDSATWLVAVTLILFVSAAVVALFANMPVEVDRVSGEGLRIRTTKARWSTDDDATDGAAREVAAVLVTYLTSVRAAADRASTLLFAAITIQIFGVAFAAMAAFSFLDSLR